jgi:hypothetical protein
VASVRASTPPDRRLQLRRRALRGHREKWFCGDCGSSIFGNDASHPESIGIRMGTFDSDPGIRPSVRDAR